MQKEKEELKKFRLNKEKYTDDKEDIQGERETENKTKTCYSVRKNV